MLSTITSQTHRDRRGLFTSLPFVSAQVDISFTRFAGTLRGLHYRDPFEEKLVLCTGGSIYDVIVGLKTGEWLPLYMSSREICHPRFVPKGFAHGFQALEDNTEVFYVVSELYDPECSRGIRFDSYGIRWPLPVQRLSETDDGLPRL